MTRRVIQIDAEKCNGCGACARACHEGAIAMVNGKAQLMRDDYCDGLGDCLPACPVDAISFVEREAAAYDAKAVEANKAQRGAKDCGCPGSRSRTIEHAPAQQIADVPGMLGTWPVQLQLAPLNAPYFDNADILVAADCTAYAYGNFHVDFIAGRTVLIACPKLDHTDYSEKLAQIFAANNIRSITVTRMTVPCCGGIDMMVRQAVLKSGKDIPVKTVIIAPDGSIAHQS